MDVTIATSMDIVVAMVMGGNTLIASCCGCNYLSSSSLATSSNLFCIIHFPNHNQMHELLLTCFL
jgi:hypothetical protein